MTFHLLVAVHHSSSYVNKRYYDAWDMNEADAGNGMNDESAKGASAYNKGLRKSDPCENKPLWFLKQQARLGKSSPFYHCLVEHGVEINL